MRTRLPTRRPWPVLYAVSVLVVWLGAVPAQGQIGQVWSAEQLQIGQRANLFAQWDGPAAFEGAFVTLPPGWTLRRAQAVRPGYQPVALQVRRTGRNEQRYVVEAPQRQPGPRQLILQVETGGLPGEAVWALTPFTRGVVGGQLRRISQHAYRVERPVRQVRSVREDGNRVLAFRGDGPPLLLRRNAVPDLGARAAYTVEFWMRTSDLNEVVLSTWNGDEQSAYPLEMVVDAGGRLRCYRGRPGQHESMATPTPVADGQWHHVALTHDPAVGWLRLFLDGAAADSLYQPLPPLIGHRTALALGGRVPGHDPGRGRGYTGLLDELHLWPLPRTASAIRRTMRQPMTASAGAVLLGFEEDLPAALVERRSSRTERIASDLAFYQPVRNVQAVVEAEGVLLTWATTDRHTTHFVVERSTDGRAFEAIGEVEAQAAPGARPNTFSFRDPDLADQVVFYRIRQRFESGSERLSSAIKLGLGREAEEDAVLHGNFPNPFNPTTTITYEVRRTQQVRVSVWDLSGQLVALLVNRTQQPGSYEVPFDASDLPSGTYFIRLQTLQGVQSHKMILTK